MSSPNYDELINLSPTLSVMPTAIKRKSLEILEQALDGELGIVDPSNPFVFLLEASAANTANAIVKSQSEVLKQYRGLATNEEELLIHMADADHKDRFSKPASHHVVYIVNKAQLVNNAVLDGLNNFKKAIIPKDTVWKVGEYSFYHHFPIVIDISPGEDIVAYFDTSVTTPLSSPNDNVVQTREIIFDNQPSIMFTIPVDQLGFSSTTYPITKGSGFKTSIPVTDKFYYARVYHTTDSKTWNEFTTTYTREAYDVNKPTVILSVTDGVLNVNLPQIYITKGLVGTRVRVDVYTTKGVVSLDLGEFIANQWGVDWNDPSDQAKDYRDAITNAFTFNVSSYGRMEGGHNGLTFDEIREATFYGLDGKLSAVTDAELENQLSKRGYSLTVQKDNVADRVYVATNKLPSVNTATLSSLPGTICSDIFYDVTRGDLPDHVINNGDRVTIKSKSLFGETSNGVELLSSETKDGLDSLDKFNLVDVLNEGRYFYNPFHYVLDASNGLFSTRVYHLDNSSVYSRIYSRSNLDLGYTFIPSDFSLQLNGEKYELSVTTENTADLTGSSAVIVFKDSSGQKFYLKSEQVIVGSDVSRFNFTFETTLDINSNDEITVINMLNNNGEPEPVSVNLDSQFDLIFITDTIDNTASPFDSLLPDNVQQEVFSAVSQCLIGVSLGKALEPLYTRSRAILSPEEYEVYADDVHETYKSDVLLKDDKGIVHTVEEDGTVSYTVLHDAGDPILDDLGDPIVKHAKGSVKLDNNGYPTVIKEERVSREIRVFLVDAKYLYSNEDSIVTYRNNIPDIVLNNVDEIIDYRPQLQGLTKLYYEPRSTDTSALVRVNSLKQAIMDTSVSFDINITVRLEDYDDINLRELTKTSIRKILASQLDGSFYSFSDTIEKLNQISGNSILSINYTSSMPGDTVTLVDLNAAFTIKSRMIPISTGKLGIEDAINFNWLRG